MHCFRDIAFTITKSLDLATLLAFNPLEKFLWYDLRKILHEDQRMAKIQIRVETLPKILTG